MNTDCRRCEDVNAFLAGELSREEQADFEMHLAACAECRAAVESTRRNIGRLRAFRRARGFAERPPCPQRKCHDQYCGVGFLPRLFSHGRSPEGAQRNSRAAAMARG